MTAPDGPGPYVRFVFLPLAYVAFGLLLGLSIGAAGLSNPFVIGGIAGLTVGMVTGADAAILRQDVSPIRVLIVLGTFGGSLGVGTFLGVAIG